ncbi:hypothetical protein PV381_07975 [Streptomyces scabiei]|uniref:hypothetical protein n=1 Tax=Streptomyces TaxID=1883 RepID=UPI001B31C2E1|nr:MULTISPECIES: hypothetical protein [Streptomyces]MBP5876744.1 hypothetical protein [Streptomyces sp. LBUM 1477]MBP5884531.1 hypothetical protein [Streptomyces sp. LBUM 1487]MDX2626500.1 hypothetical protein [Streptomyces scabiei]MDX3028576.1 hypothetical protein [Streptomyces scabiei]MDX3207354.1 hypothetical protein [Streptomyces scabiei]
MTAEPGTPDNTEPAPPYADHIRALVDQAPPFSPRQRERLRLILAVQPREPADDATADQAEEGGTP